MPLHLPTTQISLQLLGPKILDIHAEIVNPQRDNRVPTDIVLTEIVLFALAHLLRKFEPYFLLYLRVAL